MRRRALLLILRNFVVASVLLASLDGCGNKRQPDVLIVVFFDVSGSTASARSRYKTEFQEILKEVQNDSRFIMVMADRITANTEATSQFPIKARFEASKGWLGNPLKEKKQREKASQNALEALDTMLQQNEHASDIMSAFRCAGKVFGSYKETKCKILIIFSDMIEQSSRYNFKNLKLNQKNIRRIIRQEQQDGRFPELGGVQVWVSGFAVAEKGGLSPRKIKEIEDFWIAYLQEAHADVEPNRIYQTLLNFKLPSD